MRVEAVRQGVREEVRSRKVVDQTTARPWQALAWAPREWRAPGLAEGFVLGVEEGVCLCFVLGSETELFAGGRVFAVEHSGAPKQDKPLIHIVTFHVMNRAPVQHYRVSS